MGRLFGTDGVRGVANIDPMTAEMVLEIGRATAYVCKRHTSHKPRIVIGKDTRVSGYMIENALTAGICSMGVDVLLVGPMPTPGIAFITHSMRADAGVVISASHNPFQDNGIKFFDRTGFKLPDQTEREIERLLSEDEIAHLRPTATEVGKAHRIDGLVVPPDHLVKNPGLGPGQQSCPGSSVAPTSGSMPRRSQRAAPWTGHGNRIEFVILATHCTKGKKK